MQCNPASSARIFLVPLRRPRIDPVHPLRSDFIMIRLTQTHFLDLVGLPQRRSSAFISLLVISLSCGGCAIQKSHAPQVEFDGREGGAPIMVAQLEFVDFTVTGHLTQAGAARLMKEKVKVGSNESSAYEFLALSPPNGREYLRTETVEEYLAARKKGASPYTTFDITMEGWFSRTAPTLRFLKQATPSKQSLLSKTILPELSVSFLGWVGSDEGAQRQRDSATGLTLSDYRQTKRVSNWKPTLQEVRFDLDTRSYTIEVLARGDYDHDGFEDSLIYVTWHYKGGTGRGYDAYLVTRTNKAERSITVNAFDCLKHSSARVSDP